MVAAQGYNISMLVALAPLPLFIGAFKFCCNRYFDRMVQFHGQYRKVESINQDNITAEIGRLGDVEIQYRHPALTKPLLKPLIHSSWVEQIQVLMDNMHVKSRYNESETVSSSLGINQKPLSTSGLQPDYEPEFDIFERPKGQFLPNACSSNSHAANTYKPSDSICLTDLAPRSLSDSGTASVNHYCESSEDIRINNYHKASLGPRADSRYTGTFVASVQQHHPNEVSQRELLLPNSAPMGQVYSDVSTPGSVSEREAEYF